jgi:hypothetical protein
MKRIGFELLCSRELLFGKYPASRTELSLKIQSERQSAFFTKNSNLITYIVLKIQLETRNIYENIKPECR